MLPGPTELVVILVIVLIFFGAGRLPEVFRAMGEGLRSFREGAEGTGEPEDVTPAPASLAETQADAVEAEEVKSSTEAKS